MTLRDKFQWIINQNSYIFIQENAFHNVVCEMSTILSWPPPFHANHPDQISVRKSARNQLNILGIYQIFKLPLYLSGVGNMSLA